MGLIKEIRFFRSQDYNMQVLLLTVMIYAFVLPVVEIFAGAYVMRNTNDPALVAFYQLALRGAGDSEGAGGAGSDVP